MKKLSLIAIILVFISCFSVIAKAQEASSNTENSEAAQSERIERAKQNYPIRLSDKEKDNLTNRCVVAQGHLSKIAERLSTNAKPIIKRFQLIEAQLVAVQKRLAAHEMDTSVIDLLISNFRQQATVNADALSAYQQTLEDAIAVDCKADPQAFRSLLEDVRLKRKDFVNSIDAMKNLTRVDLKNSFDALRTRVKSGDKQ